MTTFTESNFSNQLFKAYSKGKHGDKRLSKQERKRSKQVRAIRRNKTAMWV